MEMKTIDFSEKDADIMADSFSFYSDMEDAIKKMSIDNLDLLYHYTTPDGLTGITGGEDLIFRFSQSDFLNDSSEGLDIFEHYYAVLEEMRNRGDLCEEFYSDAIALNKKNTLQQSLYCYDPITECTTVDDFTYRSFVCCFSKAEDALPLWNGYASNGGYSGYSLGLPYVELDSLNPYKIQEQLQKSMKVRRESNTDFERQLFLDCYSGSVIYDDTEKRTLLEDYITKIANSSLTNKQYKLKEMLCFFRPFFKNMSYAHEKEYRLLILIADKEPEILASTGLIKTRTKGMYLIPYVEVSFKKDWLKQVCMSPTTNYEDVKYSLNDYLRRNGYEDVEVCKSSRPVRY